MIIQDTFWWMKSGWPSGSTLKQISVSSHPSSHLCVLWLWLWLWVRARFAKQTSPTPSVSIAFPRPKPTRRSILLKTYRHRVFWFRRAITDKRSHHKKKGSQHARNADMMIPKVLAAFLSRFILLLAIGCIWMLWRSRIASPMDIPLICRCLSSSRAATLLLETKWGVRLGKIDWVENVEWNWEL